LPVERLVKNLAKLIEKKPKDADLLFKMARLHYLAFTNNSALVRHGKTIVAACRSQPPTTWPVGSFGRYGTTKQPAWRADRRDR
jgi:hypothetical protein